jgi:hypothetical protein
MPVWWVQFSQTWWGKSFRYGLQTSTSHWGWLSPEVEAVDTPGSLSYTALLQQGRHQSRVLVNNCSSENTSLLGAARLHPSKQILYSSSQQAQDPCKQLLQWEYLTYVEGRSSDMIFLVHACVSFTILFEVQVHDHVALNVNKIWSLNRKGQGLQRTLKDSSRPLFLLVLAVFTNIIKLHTCILQISRSKSVGVGKPEFF